MVRETINAKQAAQIIGISDWKIFEMARRGLIPHIRPKGCRRVLFRRTSLLAWLEQQEAASLKTEGPEFGKFRRVQ